MSIYLDEVRQLVHIVHFGLLLPLLKSEDAHDVVQDEVEITLVGAGCVIVGSFTADCFCPLEH